MDHRDLLRGSHGESTAAIVLQAVSRGLAGRYEADVGADLPGPLADLVRRLRERDGGQASGLP